VVSGVGVFVEGNGVRTLMGVSIAVGSGVLVVNGSWFVRLDVKVGSTSAVSCVTGLVDVQAIEKLMTKRIFNFRIFDWNNKIALILCSSGNKISNEF
jgi:hypothetical protein